MSTWITKALTTRHRRLLLLLLLLLLHFLQSMKIGEPSRGDAGEVATALYLLFCGDALWGKIDDTLETFLVPLQDWLRVLIEIESAEIMESSSSDIDLSVSFIQVC